MKYYQSRQQCRLLFNMPFLFFVILVDQRIKSFSMKMSFRLLVFAFAILLSHVASAQSNEEKSQSIAQIKETFERINKATSYEIAQIDDPEIFLKHATDNGGTLTGYFKSDTLHKIVEWVGLSNRVVQNEYYFDKGNLVFVYATEKKYAYNDSLQSLDYSKLVPSFFGRYYFKNGQLLNSLLSTKKLKQSTADDAAGFLTSATGYALLLKSRRK